MFHILPKYVNTFQNSRLFEFFAAQLDITQPEFSILVMHGSMVANKAIAAAAKVKHLKPDIQLIFEAGLLHDIGMVFTHAPDIDCFGKAPYIQHGILGAEYIRKGGFESHARICERHVGVGITKKDIEKFKLPLPKKDFMPETVEEKLICWSDKFFSKNPAFFYREKTVDEVLLELKGYGPEKADIFLEWNKIFG